MIAKITNVKHDYDGYGYEVKDIVCINYVDNKIILVTKDAQALTYASSDIVMSILTQDDEEED